MSGTYTLAEPIEAVFSEDTMSVKLDDGRMITVPIAWFPKLLHASVQQRMDYELSPSGIHWDAIDEDISVEGLLLGYGDISRKKPVAA